MGELEKEHGVSFGVRVTMKLNRYLRLKGYPSLARILERIEKSKGKDK